jgi:hypothetical protein
VFGQDWRKVASDVSAAGNDSALSQYRECLGRLSGFIQQHQEGLGCWQPSSRELEVSAKLLAGVRLPGGRESTHSSDPAGERAAG